MICNKPIVLLQYRLPVVLIMHSSSHEIYAADSFLQINAQLIHCINLATISIYGTKGENHRFFYADPPQFFKIHEHEMWTSLPTTENSCPERKVIPEMLRIHQKQNRPDANQCYLQSHAEAILSACALFDAWLERRAHSYLKHFLVKCDKLFDASNCRGRFLSGSTMRPSL